MAMPFARTTLIGMQWCAKDGGDAHESATHTSSLQGSGADTGSLQVCEGSSCSLVVGVEERGDDADVIGNCVLQKAEPFVHFVAVGVVREALAATANTKWHVLSCSAARHLVACFQRMDPPCMDCWHLA